MKRIGIFELTKERFALASQLEYAIQMLKENHQVFWYRSSRASGFPTDYLLTECVDKLLDLSSIKMLLRSISSRYENFKVVSTELYTLTEELVSTESQELESLIWQEVTLWTRDSMPCKDHDYSLFESIKKASANLERTFSELIESSNLDLVAIFNGRYLREKLLWKSCDLLGTEINFLERFNLDWNSKFFVFKEPVHSWSYRARVMREAFRTDRRSRNEKLKLASSWFERKRTADNQFTSGQNLNFPTAKTNYPLIVFFHSSEDELFTTGLTSSTWRNQFEAIRSLYRVICQNPSLRLIVRLHPNLGYKSFRENERWRIFAREFSSDQIKFILPDSPVRTYSLLESASHVLTFGSTIGVEAVFAGKPSGLLSAALHGSLDICTKIVDEKQLRDFIFKTAKKSNGTWNTDLFSYAFFLETGGQDFRELVVSKTKEFQQDPFFSYCGISLMNSRLYSILRHVDASIKRFREKMRYRNCKIDHNPYLHQQVAG